MNRGNPSQELCFKYINIVLDELGEDAMHEVLGFLSSKLTEDISLKYWEEAKEHIRLIEDMDKRLESFRSNT